MKQLKRGTNKCMTIPISTLKSGAKKTEMTEAVLNLFEGEDMSILPLYIVCRLVREL